MEFLTCLFVFLALLSASVGPATAEQPPRAATSAKFPVKITVSKETTYLLGPLKADGTVDYVAALNARLGQGVTPDNNAAIPLIRAIGPGFIPEDSRAQVFKRLGIPPLSETGAYWGGRGPTQDVLKASKAPWAERDYPTVIAWLKTNEAPLALAVEATKRPRFWIPIPEGKEGLAVTLLPPQVYEIGRALAARAMLKLHSGNAAGAWADLHAALRLARLVARDPFDQWGILLLIDKYGAQGVAALAKSQRLTPTQAKAFLSDLRALPPLPDASEVLEHERLIALGLTAPGARATDAEWKTIADLLDAPGLAGVSASDVDWDEVLRTLNRCSDGNAAALQKPNFAERRDALKAWEKEREETQKRARESLNAENLKKLLRTTKDARVTRSTLGRAVGTLLCPVFAIDRLYIAEARFRVNQVALALTAYRAERGSFPARLDDLSPGHLHEIPSDPFTGRLLFYQRLRGGYVLYSVGPDLKPDTATGAKTGDDILIRVE